MEDNQINGQKISKEAYCPNSFFDNGTISIGEFKTLDDAMNFPIKEIWCINRTEDNKFQSYKSQGSRLLIICSWNRSIQDSLKFVVAVIHKDKVGKVYYWDMNDLPLYPEERKNQYEGSLGDDATYTLYQIANNRLNCNTNMKKKLIRLTEQDLHRIVKESVNKVLTELDWKTYQNAANKAYASGDKRASKFHNQAVTQFNKDYGYDGYDDEIIGEHYDDGKVCRDDYDTSEYSPNTNRGGNYNLAYKSNPQTGKNISGNLSMPYSKFGNAQHNKRGWADISDNPNMQNAFNKAGRELSKYRNGQYNY